MFVFWGEPVLGKYCFGKKLVLPRDSSFETLFVWDRDKH